MTVGASLRTFLLASGAISTAVGGERIYAVKLPQPTTQLSILINTVSGLRYPHASGDTGLARPRMQIQVWGPDQAAVVSLADLILARMQAFRGTIGSKTAQGIFFENEIGGWLEEGELYFFGRDYLVWFEDVLS